MADCKKRQVYRCGCVECRTRGRSDVKEYHRSINRVMVELDERSRRLFAGVVARQFGRGGIERVIEITGLSRMTVRRGLVECNLAQPNRSDRVRCPGGGRNRVEKKVLA